MLDVIRSLRAHIRWADSRLLQALKATPSPPPDAITEYAHILGADEVWLSRLELRSPRVPVWPTLTLAELEALATRVHDGFDAYLDSMDEAALGRQMSYTNSAGRACQNAELDTLLHVALHAHYHRGKINLLLRQAGLEPVLLDFIAHVRERDAAPLT